MKVIHINTIINVLNIVKQYKPDSPYRVYFCRRESSVAEDAFCLFKSWVYIGSLMHRFFVLYIANVMGHTYCMICIFIFIYE